MWLSRLTEGGPAGSSCLHLPAEALPLPGRTGLQVPALAPLPSVSSSVKWVDHPCCQHPSVLWPRKERCGEMSPATGLSVRWELLSRRRRPTKEPQPGPSGGSWVVRSLSLAGTGNSRARTACKREQATGRTAVLTGGQCFAVRKTHQDFT